MNNELTATEHASLDEADKGKYVEVEYYQMLDGNCNWIYISKGKYHDLPKTYATRVCQTFRLKQKGEQER